MKLYVTFAGEEDVRFVVMLGDGETVAALKRRIGGDFRAVFPGRPPLCFFRMASSDGFFLTDSAAVSEVLEEGSTVTCHRADAEANGAPLSDFSDAEDAESALALFRSHVTYVARAACRAALRTEGGQSAGEAMSVVLALLLLEGRQLSEARLEALGALRSGLSGSLGALPTFLAAGGLFVLLSLLSPSTKMDADPGVLDGAARLLEQLSLDHAAALGPLLADCAPAALLQRLTLDSRCTASVRKRALAARRLLEGSGVSAPARPGGRPRSSDAGDRLRFAGAAVAGGGAPRLPASGAGGSGAGSPALAARLLAEHGDRNRDARTQALVQVTAAAQGSPAELRDLARSPHLPLGLLRVLRALGRAAPAPGSAEDDDDLARLGQVVARLAGDRPARGSFVKRLCECLLAAPSSAEAVEWLSAATCPASPAMQLRVPPATRSALLELVHDALLSDGGGAPGSAEAAAGAPRLLTALLDAGAPSELQHVALRALRVLLESAATSAVRPEGARGAILRAVDEDGAGLVPPSVANAALLRAMPERPLLCLEVLAGLAVREGYRAFFGSQGQLLQLLAHFCQPGGGQLPSAGEPGGQPELQRAAARCLANLSSHPGARERIRRSAAPLRATLAATEDLAARAYLEVALAAPLATAGGGAAAEE